MPNPNAVVSNRVRLIPSLDRAPAEMLRGEQGLAVELDDGRQVRLDPDDPRSVGFAQVLDGLSKQRIPVYLEVDPATGNITRLLIPHITRVVRVDRVEEDLVVQLERSHARHILRAAEPGFGELEASLREAVRAGDLVILTEDDAHNILDIRPFTPSPEGPPLPFPEWPPPQLPRRPWFQRFFRWIWQLPWWWLKCVSATKAQQVFASLSATSCDPLAVPSPCIPFLYPDDGCWARAHEMCRLMINMDLSPRKVWIQGVLNVKTKNNPNCEVWWGWHVAPTLCVRSWWFPFSRRMVMDPSLFSGPVMQATWKGVQGDQNATLTDSAASIYYLWGSVTDPTYSETNYYLAYYRLQLQSRAIQLGPPPYTYCP